MSDWIYSESSHQAGYRRGVQDGRKQAADEAFAAIHEEEMGASAYGDVDVLSVLSDLRRRLAHLFLTQKDQPPSGPAPETSPTRSGPGPDPGPQTPEPRHPPQEPPR
jgi:hypothetical protein